MVASGDRLSPTEAAAETRPFETLNMLLRGEGVLVPSGHRPGPTEPAGETLARFYRA